MFFKTQILNFEIDIKKILKNFGILCLNFFFISFIWGAENKVPALKELASRAVASNRFLSSCSKKRLPRELYKEVCDDVFNKNVISLFDNFKDIFQNYGSSLSISNLKGNYIAIYNGGNIWVCDINENKIILTYRSPYIDCCKLKNDSDDCLILMIYAIGNSYAAIIGKLDIHTNEYTTIHKLTFSHRNFDDYEADFDPQTYKVFMYFEDGEVLVIDPSKNDILNLQSTYIASYGKAIKLFSCGDFFALLNYYCIQLFKVEDDNKLKSFGAFPIPYRNSDDYTVKNPFAFALSPSKKFLIVIFYDSSLMILDSRDSSYFFIENFFENPIKQLSFSLDEEKLVFLLKSDTVKIINFYDLLRVKAAYEDSI